MDLSRLSDEQLQVYRDLLAQKLNPPDTRGLPPGQTAPPDGSLSPIPEELQKKPEQQAGGSGNEPGLPAIVVNGIKQLARSVPAFSNSPTRGTADVLEGVGKTLSPAAIPAAIMAPGAAIAGLGGGVLGQLLSGAAAKGLGAGPDTQRLAGDLGGLAGGIGGAKLGPSGSPLELLQNSLAATKGGVKGAVQGASETLKIGPTGVKISPLKALAEGYKGIKGAVADLNTQRLIQQSRDNPRIPAWMQQQTQSVPPATPPPAAAAPSTPTSIQLPSGRQVGGLQNQPVEPPTPQPRISVINGKAFLRNEKGQFYKGAEMPAPAGSTDRIVIANGKPYLNINGHLFDPKALQK